MQARFDCVNSTRQYLRYDFYSGGSRQPMQASDPDSSRVALGTTDHTVLDLVCAALAPPGPIFSDTASALVYARGQMPAPAPAGR